MDKTKLYCLEIHICVIKLYRKKEATSRRDRTVSTLRGRGWGVGRRGYDGDGAQGRASKGREGVVLAPSYFPAKVGAKAVHLRVIH